MKKFKSDKFSTFTPSDYPTKEMQELFNVILSLKDINEAKNFFRDLLTISELKEFANRWQIVKLIAQGVSYIEIASILKVSTTTVTRVAFWLNEGMDGYKRAVDRFVPAKFKDNDVPESYFKTGRYRGLKNPRVM